MTVDAELRRIYSDGDRVMQEHKQAMACLDLGNLLGMGVLLFESIRARNQWWYAAVQAKEIPYRVQEAQSFADEYREWKKATECWLRIVERFERNGHVVARADKLREFYRDTCLTDLDVKGVQDAFAALERGEGQTLDEFFSKIPDSHCQ